MWNVKDLAGSEVLTEDGRALGWLQDVLPTRGNDVFVVRNAQRELLVPALKTVVLSVQVEEKKIIVRLPPGLEDIYNVK